MSPDIRRQAIIIVATLATAYVASHFFRAANVTIGLDLMRDLGIGRGRAGRADGRLLLRLLGDADPLRLPVRPLRAAPHGDRHAGRRRDRRDAVHPGAWLAAAAGRPHADGCGFRRHADRQHGCDLALVPAGPLRDPGRRWSCRSACWATCWPPRRSPGARSRSAGAACSASWWSSPRCRHSASG